MIPAVQTRAIHAAPVIGEATPAALEGDKLTLEFPPSADFPPQAGRGEVPEPAARRPLRGDRAEARAREFALGENGEEPHEGGAASEEDLVALVKETFAREVDE